MVLKNEYPICEFDTDRNAKIKASNILNSSLPERCVITFFREALNKFAEENNLKIIGHLHSEVLDIAIYEYEWDKEKICITMPFPTAPGAAATIEELYAMGCDKFIVCGGAGCIQENINVGEIIVPVLAVRDEGTSYHYVKPSREVECHKGAVEIIQSELKEMGIPYISGKTWTTDAIYRETPDTIRVRREEGCITVEMEAAAFFAVSQYYKLPLAQLLYAGDDVSGEEWDSREWKKQKSVRENLITAAVKLVTKLV